MNRFLSPILLILLLVCGSPGLRADDPPDAAAPALLPRQEFVCPDALLRGCCENYCSKPAPCLTGFCHDCKPDNYCAKPCPPVHCFHSDCGALYCSKPCPNLCRPLAADYYICVPSRPGRWWVGKCASQTANSTQEATNSNDSNEETAAPSASQP